MSTPDSFCPKGGADVFLDQFRITPSHGDIVMDYARLKTF